MTLHELFNQWYPVIGAIILAVGSYLSLGNKADKALTEVGDLRKEYDEHIKAMERRSEQFVEMRKDIENLKDSHSDLKQGLAALHSDNHKENSTIIKKLDELLKGK